jgi:hypothetical protein
VTFSNVPKFGVASKSSYDDKKRQTSKKSQTLSEAKDLLSLVAGKKQVLRFAQDDKLMEGLLVHPFGPDSRHS